MLKSYMGDRIASVRNEAGLSQEQMASRLQVSRSAYQYYERGERDLPSTILYKICQEFKVDPSWILEKRHKSNRSPMQEILLGSYQKVAMAVDQRIDDLKLEIPLSKKWEVINFLYDEFYDLDQRDLGDHEPDVNTIDRVIKLVN